MNRGRRTCEDNAGDGDAAVCMIGGDGDTNLDPERPGVASNFRRDSVRPYQDMTEVVVVVERRVKVDRRREWSPASRRPAWQF
jgi:hypothetical protein